MYMHVRVNVHVSACTCACLLACMQEFVHVDLQHVCAHAGVHECVDVMLVCVQISMHVCEHAYGCVHICVCMHP